MYNFRKYSKSNAFNRCVAWHPSNNVILASGCLAGEVRVWDLATGACEAWTSGHSTVIASLAFHPKERLLAVATYNEIHLWDWSHPTPFASCSTSSEKEKVRFIRFDSGGNRLITGISNLPKVTPCFFDSFFGNERQQLLQRRNSLLTRVMTMYRHLEGLEEISRLHEASSGERVLQQTRETSRRVHQSLEQLTRALDGRGDQAETVLERIRAQRTRDAPLSPNTSDRLQEAREYARTSEDSSETDRTSSLWSTFRRLHTLCARLSQIMASQQQLEAHHELEPQPSTSNSGPISVSLLNLLTRLQQSLQSMSTAALTTAIAREHIQQVRLRVAEILERLVNVSGYRARLTSLRDQIFEVAERMAGTGEESRIDLIHCLWLVDMSIYLTRQMQRILAHDYQVTQMSFSNGSNSVELTEPRSNESQNSNDSQPTQNVRGFKRKREQQALEQETSQEASTSRSVPTNINLEDETTSRSRSSSESSFSIPTLRISPSESNDIRHVPSLRPRSPPLNEIRAQLSASDITESRHYMSHQNILNNWSSWSVLPGHTCIDYRIQCWDFSHDLLPNIKDAQSNVVVSKCRIHNDASVDISYDGLSLACLIPIDSNNYASSVNLTLYSLAKPTFAKCLSTWTFGSNAISVSFSPRASHIVVGLTCQHRMLHNESEMEIAQVFKLETEKSSGGYDFLKHVRNIAVSRGDDLMSVNSIRWLPRPGQGFIYGTNRGQLIIARPTSPIEDPTCDIPFWPASNVRRLRSHSSRSRSDRLNNNDESTTSISTQTSPHRVQTTGTQTLL